MILENYTKDFVALIEFLNAEVAWTNSDRSYVFDEVYFVRKQLVT